MEVKASCILLMMGIKPSMPLFPLVVPPPAMLRPYVCTLEGRNFDFLLKILWNGKWLLIPEQLIGNSVLHFALYEISLRLRFTHTESQSYQIIANALWTKFGTVTTQWPKHFPLSDKRGTFLRENTMRFLNWRYFSKPLSEFCTKKRTKNVKKLLKYIKRGLDLEMGTNPCKRAFISWFGSESRWVTRARIHKSCQKIAISAKIHWSGWLATKFMIHGLAVLPPRCERLKS